MRSNIEIKARARDMRRLHELACRVSGAEGETIEQEDTFFHVAKGRLKLRVLSRARGELIYYERDDCRGPGKSSYSVSPTGDPDSLKRTLAGALGVVGVVRKTRCLYAAGQTRIHLDEVEGLGSFVELEVVLEPGQTAEEGRRIARTHMGELGIREDDLIDKAYVDLLLAQAARRG